jgi:outer membrane lipoprotein SlyB
MRTFTIVVLAFAVVLAGCISSRSGATYSRDQARHQQDVQMGTIEHVREIVIEGTQSGIGGAAGGAVGGIGGSEVGHGKGSAAGAVVGAVLGGVAGGAIEEVATRKKGYEITVRLDSGRTIAIAQEADEEFKVGERVRIVVGDGISRVSH